MSNQSTANALQGWPPDLITRFITIADLSVWMRVLGSSLNVYGYEEDLGQLDEAGFAAYDALADEFTAALNEIRQWELWVCAHHASHWAAFIRDLEARLTQEDLRADVMSIFAQLKQGVAYRGPSAYRLYAAWREDKL